MTFFLLWRDLLPPLALGTCLAPFHVASACDHLYGISSRTFFCSLAETTVPLRNCRLRFFPFDESRCLLKPLFRLILPLPVTRNRLAAARLVFIFGTSFSSSLVQVRLLWCKQHRHIASLETRLDIDLCNVYNLIDHPTQHLPAQLRMGDLATAKEDRNLDTLAPLYELTDVTDLMFYVMGVGSRTHFHFFDFHNRMFFGSVSFLPLLITKFAVIHHTANRRLGFGRDFNQIQSEGIDLS